MDIVVDNIDPRAVFVQTRIPQGRIVTGLEYGTIVRPNSEGWLGRYVRPDGGDCWAVARVATGHDELPQPAPGETIDGAILREIEKELRSYQVAHTPNGRSRLLHIASATVTLTSAGGLGVLVQGHLILTSAHCVRSLEQGDITVDNRSMVKVETLNGRLLMVQLLAVEPISDIAVLGAVDGREAGVDVAKFEEYCETTKPVHLCCDEFAALYPFTIHIRSHRRSWITGKAQLCNMGANVLSITTAQTVESGTSGGPVVTDTGLLVGIVSQSLVCESNGLVPCPHLSIPPWLLRRIADSMRDRPSS